MEDLMLPAVGEERNHRVVYGYDRGGSIFSKLGIVEGDILLYLDDHGVTLMHYLFRDLDWPNRMIIMGVGALIRAGLIRGLECDSGIVLEIRPDRLSTFGV